MKHFRNSTGNIYTNGTDTPNDPSHQVVTDEELAQIQAENEARFQAEQEVRQQAEIIKKVQELIKSDEIADALTFESMSQFNTALAEFQTRGKVKIERYPLVAAQIQEWTTQGLI